MATPKLYREAKMIELLLDGLTITEAANAMGVSRTTVYKWLAKPEVQDIMESARVAAVAGAVGVMSGAYEEALKVLISVMMDDTQNSQTRVVAAKAILLDSLKLQEHSLYSAKIAKIMDLYEKLKTAEETGGVKFVAS